MKRSLKILLSALLALAIPSVALSCTSGSGGTDTPDATPDVDNPAPAQIEELPDITEAADFVTKTWVAVDIPFETDQEL